MAKAQTTSETPQGEVSQQDMYSVFCRLAKEAFEEIIRAQFLETQELSGPVLTM